jgi:ceramide glucosyltransferase
LLTLLDAGDETAGVNPKINNLVVPYSLAAFDILWVLDAQCSLSPTALGRAVDSLVRSPPAVPSPRFLRRLPLFGGATYARGSTARVGLVHHVPLAVSPSANLGSQVERAFLSTNHAKMYLAINTLSVDSCVMGKSNLFRKSDLARVPDAFFGVDEQGTSGEAGAIGSSAFAATASTEGVASGAARPLARFSIYLAEDNMLALSLMRPPLGLHHALAPGDAVHTSVGGISSLRAYASRRMRWIRVRKRMVLAATLLEPITESIVAGLLAAWGLRRLVLAPRELGGTTEACALAAFLAAHHVLWYNVDYGVMLALRAGTPLPPSERGVFRIAYAVRELLALPIWVGAMCGNTGVSLAFARICCFSPSSSQSPGASSASASCRRDEQRMPSQQRGGGAAAMSGYEARKMSELPELNACIIPLLAWRHRVTACAHPLRVCTYVQPSHPS